MVQLQRVRRKKIGVPPEKSKFDAPTLLSLVKDLQSGKIPLERLRVSDDMVVGLRAVISRSGTVSLHVSYEVGENRPFFKIGDVNEDSPEYISIKDAREIAKAIKAIGNRGIDVSEASNRRLLKEIRRDGAKWSPK